jgi:general secretion pathway protein A
MNQINPVTAGVFSLSPNPNFLYLTPALKAVIYQARGTIERRQGLVALLADVGMGKSTILRYLIAEYHARADVKTVAVYTPKFPSTYGLIKEICANFELPSKRSLAAQQDLLAEYLAEQYSNGVNIVLFIDEAQMLKDDLLEGVRGLLNLETNNAKLVQVVLAGQIELKARLNTERNRPLKSRIHSYALINPMTDKEMREMIDFRCNLVEMPNPFTDQGMTRIWDITKGIPRHVLKVCDKAVDYMNMAETNAVTLDDIEAAAEDAAVLEVEDE